MFNNMMELLSDVPPTLAAGWAVWFGAGLLLATWYRKAKADPEVHHAVASRDGRKPAPGSRTAPDAGTAPVARTAAGSGGAAQALADLGRRSVRRSGDAARSAV